MIFGVGQCPAEMKNKTCVFRIVPSSILGFSKVQQQMIRDQERPSNRKNEDLTGLLRKKTQIENETSESEEDKSSLLPPQSIKSPSFGKTSPMRGLSQPPTKVTFIESGDLSKPGQQRDAASAQSKPPATVHEQTKPVQPGLKDTKKSLTTT